MEYINYIRAKTHIATSTKSEAPVLSDEDEQFLNRITSEDQPLPFSPSTLHGGDAQIAIMDGAQNVALPPETPSELSETANDQEPFPGKLSTDVTSDSKTKQARSTWSWLRRDSRDSKSKTTVTEKQQTSDSLHDIAQGLKSPDAKVNEDGIVSEDEAKQEEEDMTIVLERMNLAAVNNRVFSISDETQELLQKFNQVFKDLINGVPTAYGDLESLLTNGDQQLQKTFNSLPAFLKRLIERLPDAMTKGLAPSIMAAAAEKAGVSGKNMGQAGKAAGAASKFLKTPNLKDLVGKPGAVAGMLRSIVAFLRARFPAFIGMNVLWSLALFVLLFVFWYCYKRGKETRLEKERELSEQELLKLDVEYRANHPGILYTTADSGASMDEVKAGMEEVEVAKAETALIEQIPSEGSTIQEQTMSSPALTSIAHAGETEKTAETAAPDK